MLLKKIKFILLLLTFAVTLNANLLQDIEQFNKVLRDAKKGSPLSQYWVAKCYFDGKGTQVDKKEALYWFSRSASQGYQKSMLLLGKLFTKHATSKDVMLLGIKYLESLANYDKRFPKIYEINNNYLIRHRKLAYKELIKLYLIGSTYLKADNQHAKAYLNELKQLTQDSKFAELLEVAGFFYADKKEDKKNQMEFIELIKKGSDVNATYKKSKIITYSLLFYAVIKNNRELFDLLLSKGADIDFTNERGENTFYVAIFHKNLAFAKILFDKGVKLDFATTKRNPLVVASLDEQKEAIKYLVNIGYNPHKSIINRKNLLLFMLGDSYKEAHMFNYSKKKISISFIEWAIKKYNLNTNRKTDGYYPLHLVSIKSGMREKIGLLLKYGADKNLKDKDGNIPKQFYKNTIEKNNLLIKKYENSKENIVQIKETKIRNIQGIIDNAFGKQYYHIDTVLKDRNKNLIEVIELL